MLALLQNELVLYSVIVVIVGTLLIARFIGLKKAGRWLFGKNTPSDRKAKAAAEESAKSAEQPLR